MTARLVTGVVSGTPDQVHTLDGKTHEGAVVIDVAEPFVLVHHTDRDGKRYQTVYIPAHAVTGIGFKLDETWEIPEASHTGGITARPDEYERRVVGFFDRALLEDAGRG